MTVGNMYVQKFRENEKMHFLQQVDTEKNNKNQG